MHIASVAKMLRAMKSENPAFPYCLEAASPPLMREAFLAWTETNPDKWQFPEDLGIMNALYFAWSCEKK